MLERLAPERHDTLENVPEPSEHPHLFGHGEAANKLAAAYRAGRLHHAIVIAGPAGIGKATLAFRLAYHLFSYPDAAAAPEQLVQPDPASGVFRMIAQNAHSALLHLTRPANDRTKGFRSVLTVDEIRRVGRFLSLTAHDGGWRVVIVDPADDMNNAASNALLKSLEEPPARTLFVLIAHSLGRLLPTIRSRCQIVRLKPLDDDALWAVLGAMGQAVPEGEAERARLATAAAGSARNALLLTEYGGLEIAGAIGATVTAARFDVAEAHRIADAVSGRDQGIQFGLFNQEVLERIAARASELATAGEAGAATRFSELWREVSSAVSETEIYNLDKKQHVVGTLLRLHDAMRA